MSIEFVTLPCLSDNYAVLIHDSATKETVLIDAPEAAPIQAALDARGWRLTTILLTHHHNDHIDGVAPLREGARVIGAQADAHRLPPLDLAVAPGDSFEVLGGQAHVHDAPGHTVGHIAYHLPHLKALFTGDSLMVMGCGRLFEGTAEQMWDTLSRLAKLPDDTQIYSGHEYTQGNVRFALSIEPDNQDLRTRAEAIAAARAAGQPTIPAPLGLERATNPFLRAHLPQVKAALGLPHASDAEALGELRQRKNVFA